MFSRRFFQSLFILTVLFCTGLFFAHPILAAGPVDQNAFASFAANAGFATGPSITVIIARLIRTVISLLGVIAVVLVLYGGFMYMTAGGNDERVKKAKKILINGMIGLVIVLLSFSIAQFIVGKLVDATDVASSQYCLTHPNEVPTCKSPIKIISNPLFTLNPPDAVIKCAAAVRNLKLSFVFSKAVKSEKGISISPPVEGTFSVSGQTISFVPKELCPAPNDTLHCFPVGTFHVTVDAGVVKSAGDLPLTCKTVNGLNPCSFDFTTGPVVDTKPPQEVTFVDPLTGGKAILGKSRSLQVKTLDDSGIASVDFFAIDNAAAIDTSSIPVNPLTVNGLTYANFNGSWLPNGLVTNTSYPLWATATDCAGNTKTSSKVSVMLRAPNCDNGKQDAAAPYGETGSCKPQEACDCGGDSKNVNFCGACKPASCTSNAQCSSGYCIEGKCQDVVVIQSVSPDNGAADNLVTISGTGFGSIPGTVNFFGTGAGKSKIVSAYTCGFRCVGGTKDGASCTENGNECTNGLCKPDLQWSDKEIVVQVPEGAVDGSIQVNVPANGAILAQTDRTDDAVGPIMSKFDVNAIKRPGLCSLTPNAGEINTTYQLKGLSFGAEQGSSSIYLTNFESNASKWGSTQIDASIPSVLGGSYNVQVFTGDYLCLDASGSVPKDANNQLNKITCSTDADCKKTDVSYTCGTSWCSESLKYCSSNADCPQTKTATVCKSDADCDVANDEVCDTNVKFCFKTSGVCLDVRAGSNAKSFVATNTPSASKPTVATIDTGWKACASGVNVNKHCLKDEECGGSAGSCKSQPTWGPSGQYVTIYGSGFGTSKGYVIFTNKTSNVSVNGAVDFPAACGNGFWHNDSIVVKVPFVLDANNQPTSTPLASGTYEVKVVTQPGQESDAKAFQVVEGKPTPGICALNPASGPVGTAVEILGENFGENKGAAIFTPVLSVEPENWTNTSISSAKVPEGAKSGPLLITDASSNQSNSVNFTVGNCKQTPSLCTAGQTCCSSGSCSLANQVCPSTDSKVAHFAYKVSTSPIPVAPTVVQNCHDPKKEKPSPSPSSYWSDAVCVTAAVTASFSVPMDPTTLNGTNIKIQKCPKEKEVNGTCSAPDWQDVAGAFQNASALAFQWSADAPFDTNTLYQVTIKGSSAPGGGVKSEKNGQTPGASMVSDYAWTFKTSSSNAPCGIQSVLVSPGAFTAKNLGEPVGYLAQLLASKDECVVVSCKDHSIEWNSSQPSATFLPGDTQSVAPGVGACFASVDPRYNTPKGIPAQIAATITDVGNKPSNFGLLTIALTNPKVSDYFPNCSSACGNATPWVAFNVPMDPSLFGIPGAVQIYQCQNALCDKSQEVAWDHIGPIPPPDPATNKITIPTTVPLTQNTWYRVVIAGWVKSSVFAPLSEAGSNYGSPENLFFPGDYSWRFKTKDTALSCAIDHVGLSPKSATLKYVGERQDYQATAYGSPDDCSVTGQALNATGWTGWGAKDDPNKQGASVYDPANNGSLKEITGFLLNNGALQLSSALPKYCAGNCLFTGNPIKKGDAVCGNSVVEYGESCDDGNTKNGDGCSSACLKEGTAAPVCGNAIVDAGEECDDGNTKNNDGCTSACLNEGASSVKSVCGDGVLDHSNKVGGESCDDGNTKNYDGCSSNCLFEGGAIAYTNARCGDGAIGIGEACDDGNTNKGDGCSDYCLNEGTIPGTDPAKAVCGNGKTDAGEDLGCDLGIGVIASGCSKQCLKMGSSSSYVTSSVCGNGGALEAGEQCEVSASAVKTVGPFGVAEVAPGASLEVEKDVTKATYGYAVSTIGVTVPGAKTPGSAELKLLCSCDSDNQCGTKSGDPFTSLGCGVSKCCFERPTIIANASLPGKNKNNVCRNTAIAVTFSEEMDPASFGSVDADNDGKISSGETNPNIQLELIQVAGKPVTFATDKNGDGKVTQDEYGQTDCPYYPKQTDAKNFFVGLWNWLKSLFGRAALADATTQCFVPVTFDQDSATHQVSLRYKQLLMPNAQYALTVKTKDGTKKGVVSKNQVSICLGDNGTTCQSVSQTDTFTTGTEVCSLDVVQTTDNGIVPTPPSYKSTSPGYYSKTNEVHGFTAKPYTVRKNTGQLEQISPIPALYDWSWSWPTPVKDTVAKADLFKLCLFDPATSSCADQQVQTSPNASFKAMGKNGTGDVIATATIGANTLEPSKSGTGVSGHVSEIAFLCENPWPDLQHGVPFIENGANTNFSLFYCRDIGKPGEGKKLPELDLPPTDATPAVSAKDIHPDVLKELVFRIHNTKDSIGVRVLSNPKYLSPMAWFKSQGFTGTPKPTKLDGYEAVQTGTTIYAAAANRSGSSLYSNIYVVSFNSDAGKEAQEIFSLVLQNFRLNANDVGDTGVSHVGLCKSGGSYVSQADQLISCSWDGDCLDQCRSDRKCSISGKDCDPAVGNSQCNQPDPVAPVFCDADKQKLIRDTKRLTDVTDMVATFEKYGASHGRCSVNKNQSCTQDAQCSGTEKCLPSFPSVQAGTFIPSMSNSIWPSWNSTLGNAVGAALPLDPLNQFWAQCKNVGAGFDSATCWNSTQGKFVCPDGSHVYGYQNQGGEDYVLSTELEYNAVAWNDKIDQSGTDHATVQASYKTGQAPAGIQAGSGFVSSPLYCNASAFGSSAICGDGVKSTNTCVVGDALKIGKSCVNNADCGANGICGEKCEKGDVKSIACVNGGGFINVACKSDCSDFQSEADATKLGAVCKPFACGNGVKDPLEDCDDGALNGTYGHCGLGCKVSNAFSCGDGNLAGSEQCDCGTPSNFSTLPATSWAKIGNHCSTYNGGYSAAGKNCTADCKVPGPMCGDAIVNDASEQCDKNTETYAGALNADGTKCTGNGCAVPACTKETICTSGDVNLIGTVCANDAACGAKGKCSTGFCSKGSNDGTACVSDSVCTGGGKCVGAILYDLTRTRTCQNYGTTPAAQSCNWISTNKGGWGSCAGGPQQCGNGKQEGTEECDDGNNSNNDSCTNSCKKNICGDNYVNVGIESCDSGALNGQACNAAYGASCNFCNQFCQYKTMSGPYCGDGKINGNEYCDGNAVPYQCFKADPAKCVNGTNAAGKASNGKVCDGAHPCGGDAICGDQTNPQVAGTCLKQDEGKVSGQKGYECSISHTYCRPKGTCWDGTNPDVATPCTAGASCPNGGSCVDDSGCYGGDGDCVPATKAFDGCDPGYTCRLVGSCNGGDSNGENGKLCTTGGLGWEYYPNGNKNFCDHTFTNGKDTGSGTCEIPVCGPNCGSTCPTAFQKISLQVLPNVAGAQLSSSVSLYSLENKPNFKTPDRVSIQLPACRVGTSITADLSTESVLNNNGITANLIAPTRKDASGNYVDPQTGTSTLDVGNGVKLPLPSRFICHDVPFTLPFAVTLSPETSSVTFKNFEFTYCPK